MGRALSWSLAAHAVFIVSFLLLSATRKPLTIIQAARPVRLVTYLEPSPAPRQRVSAPVVPEPARTAAPPAAPRVPAPTPPLEAPAPVSAAAPPARVAIPVRESKPAPSRTPAPPVEARPALSERLSRRLASAAPPETRPVEAASPQIASLPPPEPTISEAGPERTVPVDRTPAGDVVPVGYFPHAWYLAVLREQVFSRWSPPSEFFLSSRPPAALVSFRIDRRGGIAEIALKESSGSARYDKSALAAVRGLGRVSALPEQYREETLDVVIRFQNQR